MWFLCANSTEQEVIQSDTCPEMLSSGGQWTSRSPGYNSKEELYKGCQILDKPCVLCGHLVETHFHEPTKAQLTEKNMCFSCNIWDERSRDIRENVMIVDGSMYSIASEDKDFAFRGFGGHKFTFVKNGRVVESTNVWFGGEIPAHFRNKIPDNAIKL